MKFGLRGHDLGRQDSRFLAKNLQQCGYDCLQLVFHKIINGLTDYDDPISNDIVTTLLKSFTQNSLEVALVGCYRDFANSSAFEYNIKTYDKYIKLAKAVGSKYVGTETSLISLTNEEIADRRNQLKIMTQKVCNIAYRNNICILLEPVASHPLNTPELCAELLTLVPEGSLKFIFDAVNIIPDCINFNQKALWDYWFSFHEFVSHIAVIHFKDFYFDLHDQKIPCQLGKGNIDWFLLSQKFNLLNNLEYAIREEQDPKYYKEDLGFMKKIIKYS